MMVILKMIRLKQWAKNMFVFLPLFFDGKILNIDYLVPASILFFSFCFAASGVYCFNDIHDVEADRKHPKKCGRPIASGAISKTFGMGIMTFCFLLSCGLMSMGFIDYLKVEGGEMDNVLCDNSLLCLDEYSLLH